MNGGASFAPAIEMEYNDMLDFCEPKVSETINKLSFFWDSYELRVAADRLDSNGKAELWFYHCNGKSRDSLLHTTSVNLLSTPSLSQLVKRMQVNSGDIPWQQVLTFIARGSMEFLRRGEPGVILQPVPGTIYHPGYYIEPLLLKGLPNLIHGPKGAGKSTLGLTVLGICRNAVSDSQTGLIADEEARVGILDWENDSQTTTFTISCLVEGETVPYFEPAYLRCTLPLAEDAQRIADWVSENRLSLVLIDSLGGAAGADAFDSSGKRAALRFFQTLRQLKVTSLIIGQEAKSEEATKRTTYGSVYYQYYSRNIFELKTVKDMLDASIMHMALFHQEANFSALSEPMGFRVTFGPGNTSVEAESVKLSQFLERASQTKAIAEFLKGGAKHFREIARAGGLKETQTKNLLSRLKKRGIVVDLGMGMWGLTVEGDSGN